MDAFPGGYLSLLAKVGASRVRDLFKQARDSEPWMPRRYMKNHLWLHDFWRCLYTLQV